MKTALSIAGSDCSGGAGIQADIKTMSALGVFAMSVIVSVVAENTSRVISIEDVSPRVISDQIDAVFEDIWPDAVKIGMLSTPECMKAVAGKIREYRPRHVVIDPVMYAKNGSPLMQEDSIDTLISTVIPLATVLTPNIPEAEKISGIEIHDLDGMKRSAEIISRMGALSWALMLLLLTARNEEIIRGLRAFHMPYNAALAASMVLRFIPHLGLLFSEIRDSMSLRLDEGRRGYPMLPSITALTVAAIRMIPETAAALEERGFGRMAKMPNEPIPRPRGYSLQWLLGAIIPLSLLIVR